MYEISIFTLEELKQSQNYFMVGWKV